MSIFLSVPKKEFLKILTLANNISFKKDFESEVFSQSKITLKNEMVLFEAVNPDTYLKANFKPSQLNLETESFVFLVKTELFFASISLLSDEEIGLEIDTDKKTMKIQGSKAKHQIRISTENIEDYYTPNLDTEKTQTQIKISTNILQEALKACNISVGQAKKVYQPEFLNICFTVNGENLFLVSSDRYRIIKNVLECEYLKKSEETVNYLVLPKNLNYLTAFSSEFLQIDFNGEFLQIQSDELTLITRYGDGKYPDYDKIIPQSFSCQFELDTKETLNGLKQVQFAARTDLTNRRVTLDIKPSLNKILLSSKSESGEVSQYELDLIEYEGVNEDWSQAFNSQYLLDYLQLLSAEKVLFEANPGKPAVLSQKDQKAKQLYLISGLK
jgi:DNA polymerase-3 subunit beta